MDDNAKVLVEAARRCAEGGRFALVTVVRTAGSTPRKAGARMLVAEGGEVFGSVGGGAIEHALVSEALESLRERRPRLVRRHLTRDLAMCCGGEMEAFIEPVGLRETLVLAGAGHIHAALSPVAQALGFEVVVADDLEEYASAGRFPGARLVHAFEPRGWGLAFTEGVYVVIATRDHAVDQRILEELASGGARPSYLGVVGSRAKILRFKQRLEAKGVEAGWIEQIRGPVGLEIGAETPAEIAVSIAAELVAVRHREKNR